MKSVGITQIYNGALQFYNISTNITHIITMSTPSYEGVRQLDLLRMGMLSYKGEEMNIVNGFEGIDKRVVEVMDSGNCWRNE